MNPLDPTQPEQPETPTPNLVDPPKLPVAPQPIVPSPVGQQAPPPAQPEPFASAPQPQPVAPGAQAFAATPLNAPKKSKKKLILIIVAAIIGIGLLVGGFFGFKAFAASQNKKAAQKAADTFVDAYMASDLEKIKSVYMGEVNESDFAQGSGNIFAKSEFLESVVGKKDGHDTAVASYKLTIKEDAKLGLSGEVYILLILHKENGKWMVEDGVPSITEPKVSLDAKTSSTDESQGSQHSNDTERETDIKALHGQLEAYYAQHGTYPTLAQLNDQAFRTANMQGLDSEALQDPEGSSAKLANEPAKHVYSYEGGGQAYTLTATKSDGATYVKRNLN